MTQDNDDDNDNSDDDVDDDDGDDDANPWLETSTWWRLARRDNCP